MKQFDPVALRLDPIANNHRQYRQCAISVMDTIADPHITFDENGVCNYYHDFLRARAELVFTGESGMQKTQQLVQEIRAAGHRNTYDCIAGVSGGVDSTFVALRAKELGLNPLLVHFDNGWNSETANKNIENIIKNTGFDLFTLVVNWDEFRDLQRAYFKANVVDIEALTDHAIISTLYRLAAEKGIRYILSGTNVATEQVLPAHWIWPKNDGINVRAIHNAYGTIPLKTYPTYSSLRIQLFKRRHQIRPVSLLNFMDYDKEVAKKEIAEKLGWQDYGGKHFESVFTRFYQGYILPVKFGIDKRKAHLSTLIFDGKLGKEAALQILDQPIYDSELMQQDYQFVRKKLGFTENEFSDYFVAPRVEHSAFASDKNNIWENYPVLKALRPLYRLYKRIRH